MSENKNYYVNEHAVVDDGVEIGDGTKVWHFSHIQKGSKIGKNCVFGQNVNVGNNVTIGGLLGAEIGDQRIELRYGRRRKSGNFGKMRLCSQRLQPFDLDLQTGADQAELGKMLAQGVNLAGIAAIERGKGSQGIESHGHILFSKPVILPA